MIFLVFFFARSQFSFILTLSSADNGDVRRYPPPDLRSGFFTGLRKVCPPPPPPPPGPRPGPPFFQFPQAFSRLRPLSPSSLLACGHSPPSHPRAQGRRRRRRGSHGTSAVTPLGPSASSLMPTPGCGVGGGEVGGREVQRCVRSIGHHPRAGCGCGGGRLNL